MVSSTFLYRSSSQLIAATSRDITGPLPDTAGPHDSVDDTRYQQLSELDNSSCHAGWRMSAEIVMGGCLSSHPNVTLD
jgi:hypothetical protein